MIKLIISLVITLMVCSCAKDYVDPESFAPTTYIDGSEYGDIIKWSCHCNVTCDDPDIIVCGKLTYMRSTSYRVDGGVVTEGVGIAEHEAILAELEAKAYKICSPNVPPTDGIKNRCTCRPEYTTCENE